MLIHILPLLQLHSSHFRPSSRISSLRPPATSSLSSSLPPFRIDTGASSNRLERGGAPQELAPAFFLLQPFCLQQIRKRFHSHSSSTFFTCSLPFQHSTSPPSCISFHYCFLAISMATRAPPSFESWWQPVTVCLRKSDLACRPSVDRHSSR